MFASLFQQVGLILVLLGANQDVRKSPDHGGG
jgi:hypothetical protein